MDPFRFLAHCARYFKALQKILCYCKYRTNEGLVNQGPSVRVHGGSKMHIGRVIKPNCLASSFNSFLEFEIDFEFL